MKANKTKKEEYKLNIDEMEKDVNEAPKRNLTGSLEQCKEELRDAYMNYSDRAKACILDINTVNKSTKPVYYFKPDTFLLDEPTQQVYFRDKLLHKISSIPKPEPINYLGDEMHKIFLATVADQSRPTICKRNLGMFYKRRQYALQHLKYKVLQRWAHLAIDSAKMETSKDAVFLQGKIEYSIEQAMLRAERLDQDDFFDEAIPQNRPNTKAELGEGSLYVENVDLQPQSLIREDDIEIYMRSTSYRNKVSKVVNKFMSRLKWLPMMKRYDVYKKALESKHQQKEKNIDSQHDFIKKIEKRARKYHIVTAEMESELNDILNTQYFRQHAMMYTSQSEKTANSWRSDHDTVPNLINNAHELKLKIKQEAKRYGIKADIELDHGYSYSYRVTVIFPPHFQKQCIKSQFSLYDVFARESDKNQVQKHTLSNMTRVDTNIFRDISTTPNMVPDDESLAYELRDKKDIKVMRMKSCAYWIDYVCMLPTEPEWHRKQQALLNNGNPIDTLTRSGMNFLDASDMASVNRINEDNALLHQQAIKKIQAQNVHNMVIQRTQNSNDGEKKFAVNLQTQMNSTVEEAQIDKHLMHAVQGGGVASDIGNGRDQTLRLAEKQAAMSRSGLRNTAHHLLVSFFTLRYMKSRDNKIKILYALNFARAMQKRLCLDLREFGTRERVDAHQSQPYVHSTDTDKMIVNKIVNAVSLSKNTGIEGRDDKQALDAKQRAEEEEKYEKMTVFDPEVIANMRNMASVRMYKQNGTFNNKVFSTCPSVPRFHATFGEPTSRQTEDIEMDNKKNQGGISKQSLKLMGRVDHIEIDEELEEVYVRDDFGVYILYDCVLQDMKGVEEELIKICSYFINKSEVLQDVHTEKPQPNKDRLQTLSDLLECEATFQFKKVKLCLQYLECYEHIVDPLEQQRLMQVLTDLMARRPRLNLQANYFKDAYAAEFLCLDNQFALLKEVVKNQIDLERTNNKMLQDSLNLSYTLCNQYEMNRFKYQDAEDLLQAVIAREKNEKAAKRYAKVMRAHNARRKQDNATATVMRPGGEEIVAEADDKEEVSGSDSGSKKNGSEAGKTSNAEKKTKGDDLEDLGEPSINSDMSEMDILNRQENVFQTLLGLPEISIETLYMAFREKDKTILNLMREQTNFIQIHEGYPEFLNFQQGGTGGDGMRTFQACPWSEKVAHMDFYDSLGFVNKLSAILTQVSQELYDVLKPYDATMMTYIDAHVAEFALEEYHRVLKIQEGAEVEYVGRQYVEDESVIGNSDKLVFYSKEMTSQLTLAPKATLDPYLIAKLNMKSISYFDFPRMPKNLNKYTMQFKDGVLPSDWVIQMHKQQIVDSAKRRGAEKTINIEHVFANAQMGLSSNRNIDVPSQLQTYCNVVELMRLRHEIILAASECSVLEQIYKSQAELCGAKMTSRLGESISFDTVDIHDDQADIVNFLDEGPSHNTHIDLAIREFDPTLLSNFNFRNPDTFKLNITDAGLEEVRAILMYQLLQKHLLIVGTRLNQLLLDSSQKALVELNLLQRGEQKEPLVCPNATYNINEVFQKNAENISQVSISMERKKFRANITGPIQLVFYDVAGQKRQMRTDMQKEFSNYMCKVTRHYTIKNQCVQRVMRSFKIKQLVRYCETVFLQTHLDAQKVQAVQVCQRLRVLSQYFTFNPARFNMTVIQKGKPGEPRKDDYQVFKYETNNLLENFTYPYMPADRQTDELENETDFNDVQILNTDRLKILDLEGIPSSAQLVECESSSIDEMKVFKKRLAKIHLNYNKNWQEDLKNLDVTVDYPEKQTKEMLPTLTQKDIDPKEGKGKPEDSEIDKEGYPILDFEEALNFGNSTFAHMIRYYQYMERILSLEWFIIKLQFKHDVAVHIDDAFNLGLPFWVDTDYENRMKQEVVNRPIRSDINVIAQNFLHSNIVSRQSKKFIAEEISNVSLVMQNLIRRYRITKEEQKYEYLNSYTEFRYMQILGSFHKIIQQFYIQKRGGNGIRSIREAISQLAKIDHVRTSFSKGNSYHVNTSLVHPHMQLIENTNLIYGAHSEDEYQNFVRCVQPVINEKALEPPQITLFQSLYQTDSFRKRLPTQFAGQLLSTHNARSFNSLDTALLDMSYENRQYSQSFIMQAKDQANDYMEMTYDPNMATMQSDDVYNNVLDLEQAKKYLADGTQALLLKNALICWNENQVLPDDPELYARFEEHFRNNFFWKIIEQKENFIAQKENRPNAQDNMPTKKELVALKQKITDLQANYSLATATEEQHRDLMVDALKKEFTMQKKKVTLDQFFTTKAEILVLQNEIEKHIMRASVQTLDAETAALVKCFEREVPKIQYRIHPFQQFAATLYDQVDPNKHLDMVQKLGFVQDFLTQLANRGTEVETLTSGPGVVFTRKDFNDAIQRFCRKFITYGVHQLKSHSDLFCQKEEHYLHLIYVKDQKICELDKRIKNQSKNIENIISARLFEKGNQLIYQLDSTSRLLILFKQTMYGLESEIRNKILGEQAQKFKLQKDALDTQIEKLDDYKQHVGQIVDVRFTKDYDAIMQDLKKTVEKVWNIDPELNNYIPPTLYPATGDNKYRNPIQQIIIRNETSAAAAASGDGGGGGYGRGGPGPSASDKIVKDLALEAVGTLPGSVIPDGFTHYSHCTCFKPSKKYPNYTLEHAELEMYSEQEARFELAKACEVMRKQRLFWRTKEMLMKQKFQNKINLMKKQLSNNAYLWDQMAESEKRETILKQELLFTQQSLSASEKVIEKLQEEMKKVEADRQRLIKYKHQKAERLKELEDKIKKFEVYENIDTDKLINVLGKKDEECRALSSIADNFTSQLGLVEHQKQRAVGVFKNKLVQEQVKTQQIVEKMEQMKLELKMLESNDTSVAAIWKKKCLDLFEVCQTLKQENEELRDRCKELIVQGMQLADAVTQEHEQQNTYMLTSNQPVLYQTTRAEKNHVSLPKLQQNNSVRSSRAPGTADPSGRGAASTANTYEMNSNLGGYGMGIDSRIQGYGVISQQSANKPPFEDMTNPGDSTLGHKMQSHYSGGGPDGMGKSQDGRFASTLHSKGKYGPFGTGASVANPAQNMLRSPPLQQMGQRSNMRGTQRGNFHPQTQHQPQRMRRESQGNNVAGPNGPTYYMPSQQDRASNLARVKNKSQARSILNSGGGVTATKDNLGESSFNQSFHATNSDKYATAPRAQISSQQARRQINGQKLPQNALEARGVRQQQNTTAMMMMPGAAGTHNDSLFESSKASTTVPGQFARRQFNKNMALTTNTQVAAGGRGMVVTQNQRQTEMMGAAVLGSKMTAAAKQGGLATAGQSTAMKIQSTKLGSQITEMPSASAAIGSKSLAPISQEQPLAEASFAAVADPEVPGTRATDSTRSIDNLKQGELLNTEMTLNKLASEDGTKTIGEEEH